MRNGKIAGLCFVFLSFIACAVFAEEESTLLPKSISDIENYTPLLDFDGMPGTIVDGCVNAITGNYFETACDYVGAGPNPITICRYFSSSSKEKGQLADLWALNIGGWLNITKYAGLRIARVQDRGVFLPFCAKKHDSVLEMSDYVLDYGVVNIPSPYESGRSYLPNKLLHLERDSKKNSYYVLNIPGNESMYFNQEHGHSRYYLSRHYNPNGCSFSYDYKKKNVTNIKALNRKGQVSHSVKLETWDNQVDMTLSDGRKMYFRMSKMKSRHHSTGERRYCLTEVQSDFAPLVRYCYNKTGKYSRDQLVKRYLPDNRYKQIIYCKSSKVKDKVSSLFAPVGVDAKPVLTHRFEYQGRHTVAYDAYGHWKNYSWNGAQRVTQIEEAAAKSPLYRTEQYYWGGEWGALLQARVFQNGGKSGIMAKTYRYDGRGNILEEILAGNLTGGNKAPPEVDDKGVLKANGCEKFSRTYAYNGLNQVISEKDNRQEVQYAYYPNLSLIKQKSIHENGAIKQRYYYEYDDEGAVTLEVIDDGSSPNINDLANVTERKIKRFENTKTAPAGLPRVISEYCLDRTTGGEVLLQKTVNTFSKYGQVIKEELYDANDRFVYAKHRVINAYGCVVEETDPVGRKTTYKYDANKNCIFKQTPNSAYYTLYTYDFSNRLIKEEQVHTNGERFAKSYAYDYKGNRTGATDIYGNTTQFVYDPFDRLVKRIFPPIPDSNGQLVTPREIYSWDELNNPREKKDTTGGLTKVWTTVRGDAYRIEHPDGTAETLVYNLDGTLKEAVNAAGTKIVYDYDYQKRTTGEKKFSPNGELLSAKSWEYNAFHLVRETDPLGEVTTYSYDCAGRLIAQRKADHESLYFYDALGRQTEKWESCGNGDYRVRAVVYDVLGQIIEERTESASGEVFLLRQYGYDVDGNRTHQTLCTETENLTTVTLYNPHGKPLRVTAPDGTETIYLYDYHYRNAWNQPVPCEQVIDPLGNVTIVVRNTHDAVALEEKKNPLGETIRKTHFINNAQGWLERRTEEIIFDGKTEHSCATVFSYDLMGRETAIFEAHATPEQKVTRREYNVFGQVSKVCKPDGVTLFNTYDSLGRLIVQTTSDDSLAYEYHYDANDNILWAKDTHESTLTLRLYDPHGRILSETLDNGLSFEYAYDPLGRLTQLELPDTSKVTYSYDAGYLREVAREGHGSHQYHYGLSGKLVRAELMYGLGEVTYQYDTLLRLTGVDSPHWRMSGTYDAAGNLTNADQGDSLGDTAHRYAYDAQHQLVGEQGWEDHNYNLDSIGNRRAKDSALADFNLLNQLKSQGSVKYAYDLNGNLIRKIAQETTEYHYDALDRLAEVVTSDMKAAYHYDPFHRRTWKKTYKKVGEAWEILSEERYLYQNDKEIGVVDADENLSQLRVLGLGAKGDVGGAVLMELDGKAYVPAHNYHGDVVSLVDAESGAVVEMYRYTAYGEERVYDAGGHLATQSINPWRFSSKRVDEETGWAFFGRRYYDAEAARWTTPDPLWFVDGPNLYAYVGNRPTQFIDPEGLFWNELWEIVSNTFSSIGEAFTGVNVNVQYDNGGRNFSMVGATAFPFGESLDKRSQIHKPENTLYGPVYVTFINGVLNSEEDAEESRNYVAEMVGDCPFCGIYNATHGLWDFAESTLNVFGVTTRPAQLLAQAWKEHFNNCSEDGIIIHVCHSQGTALTKKALKMIDPELRERIHVIAVAPSSYIGKDLCGSVVHLVSNWDVVPRLDFVGRWRYWDTIQFVPRDPNAGYFDHEFQSPSYKKAIRERIAHIRRKFGDQK